MYAKKSWRLGTIKAFGYLRYVFDSITLNKKSSSLSCIKMRTIKTTLASNTLFSKCVSGKYHYMASMEI